MKTTIEINTVDAFGFGNTTTLTDRQLTIIRRALVQYATRGADGMTTETMDLNRIFADAHVSQKEASVELDGDIVSEGDPSGW